MTHTTAIAALLTSVLAGCLFTTDDDGPPSPNPGGGSGSSTTMEQGGPRILSFTVNRTSLSRTDEEVILSAIVTDVDGVDDVIGGTLFVDGTSASLGTFATSAQEGAYTMTVTWREMLEPLGDDFAVWDGKYVHRLRAEFFDQAGHKASQVAAVTFGCQNTASTRFGVTPAGCVQGATCLAGTYNGEFRRTCEAWEEVTTGETMCQRAFGTSCTACGHGSPDGNEIGCTQQRAHMDCSCDA